MHSTDEQRVESIAMSIAAYWQSHPNAADSTEGIVWWIPELRSESAELLQRAMALLVARGIARARHGSDGHVVYSRRVDLP